MSPIFPMFHNARGRLDMHRDRLNTCPLRLRQPKISPWATCVPDDDRLPYRRPVQIKVPSHPRTDETRSTLQERRDRVEQGLDGMARPLGDEPNPGRLTWGTVRVYKKTFIRIGRGCSGFRSIVALS